MLLVRDLCTDSTRQLEKTALEEEREKIRELHQRQQDSLQCLQVLEKGIRAINLDNDESQHTESRLPSAIPTSAFMIHPNPPLAPNDLPELNMAVLQTKCKSKNITTKPDSPETSYNDSTVTDDEDEDNRLILEELTKATNHIQLFLERITELQEDIGMYGSECMEQQVRMLYRRFCRKWESNIFATSKAPSAMPRHHSHAVPQLAQGDGRDSISNKIAVGPYKGVQLQDTISMVNEHDELSENVQDTTSMRGRKRKTLVLPTTLSDRQQSPARCLIPPASSTDTSKPRRPSGYRHSSHSRATSDSPSTGASSPDSPGPGVGCWAPEYHFSEAPLRLSAPTAPNHEQSITGSQSETALVPSSAPSWSRQRSLFRDDQEDYRSPSASDIISPTGNNVSRPSHGEEPAMHGRESDYSENDSLDEYVVWGQRWSKRPTEISDELEGTRTSETEVDARDIVDVLLEQWTVQGTVQVD